MQIGLTAGIVLCCLFPFLMTVLGAAAVFLCPRGMHAAFRRAFLGFSAGVMLAASIWSLLNPAIEAAAGLGLPGWLPASVGLSLGVLFLLAADLAVMRVQAVSGTGGDDGGSFLLQLAMTVHNIPEGMAVGVAAALAADAIRSNPVTELSLGLLLSEGGRAACGAQVSAAIALSLGIGIQNFPEGAAVSLPLCRGEGSLTPWRAFLRGCLSGIVEPIAGLLTVFFLCEADAVMPWLLSFAAGAMLYVVAEELIPSANAMHDGDRVSFVGTLSTVAGFLLMMILDVALE